MKLVIAIVAMCAAMTVSAEAMFTSPVIGNPAIANGPQEECMALNVYYEARSDNLAGKYAVADVVLNRVRDERYPDSICGVVQQGRLGTEGGEILKHQCQFSWYCDGLADTPTDQDSWQKAQMVAYNIINYQKHRGISEGATHYHATYVNPYWVSTVELVGTIGQHVFYRWE
ncbi:MAG: cell wall hydrolase [Actinobacteria bacterium]|nr:cell wall hydrolase [Actinomycetota bacterium]